MPYHPQVADLGRFESVKAGIDKRISRLSADHIPSDENTPGTHEYQDKYERYYYLFTSPNLEFLQNTEM